MYIYLVSVSVNKGTQTLHRFNKSHEISRHLRSGDAILEQLIDKADGVHVCFSLIFIVPSTLFS